MSTAKTVTPPTYYLTYRYTPGGQAHAVLNGQQLDLESGYFVDDRKIAHAFGSVVRPELADLVDIALAVYVADRLSARRPPSADRYHLHWTRHFNIQLPVRDPDRWRSSDVSPALTELLWLFTEDEWNFDFIPRAEGRRASEMQRVLFPNLPQPPVTAVLFSGGLDSLAGLCHELIQRSGDTFVLFSGATNDLIGSIQRRLARTVRSRLGREVIPVVVPLGLRHGANHREDAERTQRSRGFLFLALGAVTAMMAGTDELAIYENGIGAINLPYTDAQLGTHNTRAAHPLALSGMQSLISIATERQFTVRSPFLLSTKGQVCASLGALKLGDLVSKTVSCDGFPQRFPGHPQCGLCTSCLLRRQSLYISGLGSFDAPDTYHQDVMRSLTHVPDAKLYPFRVMLDQVARIRRATDASEPWKALSGTYPQLLEIAASIAGRGELLDSVQSQLVRMHRSYCDEWDRFPARPPKWPMGRLA